jgi:hypothetical protein
VALASGSIQVHRYAPDAQIQLDIWGFPAPERALRCPTILSERYIVSMLFVSGSTHGQKSLVMRERLVCMQEGLQTSPLAGDAALTDVLGTNEPHGTSDSISALPPSPVLDCLLIDWFA